MFDFVRKHTKIMQFLLFLLIFPSFVLFGLDGYNRFRDQGDVVAMVDGQAVRQGEWDMAHKQETERLRQSMPNVDPKLLDSPEAKYASLERVVRDKVVQAAADKLRLTSSDQRVAKELNENPSIAALRRPDGSLDMDKYKQLVGSQGLSPEGFEARVRQDLSMRQVLSGVGATGLNAKAVSDAGLGAFFERREIQVQRFTTADYVSKVTPTDDQLDQFYKTNPQLFQAPESASIEYVVLDLEAAKKGITLKPEDVKAYYDQNAMRLGGQEERRASHILINAPKSMSAAERSAAKAKADAIAAEVKKAPDTFADSAKKNSQDPGSKDNGGDLDFFPRGAMVKPFEEAVFSMQKGDISPVVESEFGYHIIRLTEIKAPKQKTFEELKPEIEADLIKQQAQKKFAEMAEGLTNLVYEQADTLKPVNQRLGLEIKTAANVLRNPGPATQGALSNARLLSALFSADSIDKKRNTEAIEVGKNQLVSARIVQYTPAKTMAFAEVKDRVKERVLNQMAADLAKKEGQAKFASSQTAPANASLPEAITISRENNQKQPSQIIEAALRADSGKLPAVSGVDLGTQGYAVVRVNKVLPRDVQGANIEQDRKQVATWWSSAENLAYYNTLKERFKVEMKVTKPVAKKDEALTP